MSELVNSFKVDLGERGIKFSGTVYLQDYIKSWIIVVNAGGTTHDRIRNINIAKQLSKEGHATFHVELLAPDEETSLENRVNLTLLSSRLLTAIRWLISSKHYRHHTPIGMYGARISAAVAVMTVASFPQNNMIYAIVTQSGRLDLVDDKLLSSLFTPTLLIAGSEEREVIESNKVARESLLNCRLSIVHQSNYQFEVPGAVDEAVKLASEWFDNHVPQFVQYSE